MASIIEASIQNTIAQALAISDSAASHAKLNAAFDELQKLKADNAFLGSEGEGDSAHITPDLVLVLCEAAITARHTILAKKCLVALLQGSTTTRSFQIRAVFCQAQVEASESENLRGDRLVQATVDALMKVVQGMKIALQDVSELSSLLYRGAQYVWSISRGLFREGTYATIVSALGFVVYCLEAVEFTNWTERIGWMMRYAIALDGCGRHLESAAYLTKTAETAAKVAPHLSHAIYKIQVVNSVHCPNPKFKADAAKGILKPIYASQAFLCGLLNDKAQADVELIAAFEEWKHEATLAEEATKRLEDISPMERLQQSSKKQQGKGGVKTGRKGATQGGPTTKEELDAENIIREDALGDLGISFMLNGQLDYASQCADLMDKSKQLKVRVFGEFIRVYNEVDKYGGFAVQDALHASSIPADMINKLVTSVRKVERSLESAVRVDPPRDRTYTTEVGCVLLWKIVLPLLQEGTRKQIARSLHYAAKSLDDTSSNMNELRVLLHYESSICDADEEYLNKATIRIDKALSIDYTPSQEECQLYSLDRPLDRLIVWSKRRLETKANLYKKHTNPVDEALLIIEQSRDAPVNSRISMLTRAMSSLQASEPPLDYFIESPPSSPVASPSPLDASKINKSQKGGGLVKSESSTKQPPKADRSGAMKVEAPAPRPLDLETEKRRSLLRDRASVWNLVMTYGWQEHNIRQVDVVTHAAERILERVWTRSGDRDMRIMQAQAHITLVQTQSVELQSKGLRIGQISFIEDEDSDLDEPTKIGTSSRHHGGGDSALATEIAEKMATVATATKSVKEHISAAARIAKELILEGWPEEWLLINVGVLLWNTFLPSFLDNDFISASESLEVVFPMLMDPTSGIDAKTETSLFQDLGHAYAQSLLQHHLLSQIAPDDEQGSNPVNILKVAQLPLRRVSMAADPNSAYLQSAASICEQCITALRTPMDAKNFLLLAPTIRRFLGPTPVEPLPAPSRAYPQQQLLMYIDELAFPQITAEQRNALVPRCLDLLTEDPNVELCARLSEVVLDTHPKAAARIAIIGRGLQSSGKLGIRQDERKMLLIGQTTGALPQRAGSKEGIKDKKKVKDDQSIALAEQEAMDAAVAALPVPDATPMDWMWYSLLLQFQAAATVMLINPALQEKRTQFEIRIQALSVLAESSTAALNAPRQFSATNVMKNMRHYHQISEEIANDPTWRHLTYDSVATMMSGKLLAACVPLCVVKPHPSAPSDADVMSGLMLMLLGILTDTNRIDEGLVLMKVAIGTLPASHHRPFWSLDIQIRCEGGLPTQQTLLRVKEFSAEMQAQAWLSLCRHSPDPKDQMYAYQKAVDVLKDSTTERAEVMVSMAQWALSSNAPMSLEDVRTMILAAIDSVVDECDIDPSPSGNAWGDQHSELGGHLSDVQSAAGRSSIHARSVAPRSVTSPSIARSAASHSTMAGGVSKKKGASVRQLLILVKAYYVLAKIGGQRPVHCLGLLVDARSAFRMFTHICLTLWHNTVSCANEHVRRQAARVERREIKSQLVAQKTTGTKGGATPRDDKSKKPSSAKTPRTAPVAQFPDPVELPSQCEDWITFVIPSSLVSTLQEVTVDAAVGPASIGDASQLVGLLRDAIQDMATLGLEWECAPVLSLSELVIRLTSPPLASDPCGRAAAIENHFTRWDLCYRLRLGASALPVSSLQPMPSGTERAALMEDARLVEQRHGQVRRKKGPGVSPVSLPAVGLPKTPIHVFWVSIASHLVAQGRIGQACDVLQDARYHARAYRDARSFAQCNLLDAQIARLEGRFADSIEYAKITADLRLDSQGDCIWEDSVPVEMVAQAVTLIAESYVQMHDLDMAFKTIYGLVKNLKGWIAPKKGLWKDVAHLATPVALCTSITNFAQVVLDEVARHDMLNRANPKRERKQGSSELVASSSEAVMHVGRLLSEISPLMFHCPQQESAVLFLETRINELHANECLYAGNARDSKTGLQMEAKALLEAISSLKVQISGLGEQRGLMQAGNPNEAATPGTAALAQVFAALGDNILRRVKLNSLLLDDLRQSTLSRVAAPVVEGAPAELHGEVVKFMRSSNKQRDANKRKNSRLAKREELETIRSQKREDRQAEVERQRELRKQDELLTSALSPQVPTSGRKDIKRRASKTRRDTVETVVAQQEAIPDVDPEDKCGLDSINTSSDSGLDEDNQSDEEEEMALALKGLPDAEVEARITFGDALVYFTQAQELLGANRAGVSRTEEDIMLRTGRCLMLMEEASIIAQDQRAAIVAGDEPPLLGASPTIEAKWAAPIEVPNAEEELRKVGSVVTKKDDKNTPKRTGGTAARDGAVSAMSTSPATASSSSQYSSLLHSVLSMRRVSSNRAAQGTSFLASSALAAHHTGALVPLASAMLELANSAILLGEPDVAGVCLEYAQAASTSNFVHALWSDVATPDTPEASLIRLVDEVERRAPHLCESPHFHGILKLVHLHSPMSVRLSLPEPTFLRALAPDSVVEKSSADNSFQLPSDICVVSLNVVEPTSSRYVCVLMSVRRPNSPFIVRRAQIPTEEFYKLIQRRRQISMQRRSQLSSMGSASAATQGKVEAAFVQYVEDTEAALGPLLSDLFTPLNAIAQRCQLFICVHPTLSPLPFEALEPFNRFRSVSRDLSVFTVNQRLLRRDAEGNKLNTNHSIMVVDPYAENEGLSHQAIYGDVRPRVSSWVTVGSIIDSEGFSRPVQKEALISALTHPSSAALVANMAGKLTSLISLPEVASLSLEHLRAAFLFDTSVLEKALRRESQQNMTKSPQMLMYESNSWYMPLLMLARGVDYCVTNSMPASASFNDFISRTAVASLERTTVSFTDTICACIGREPGMGASIGGSEIGGDEAPVSRHESPLGTRTTSVLSRGGAHSRSMMNTPLQGSTFSALERFGLLFYGLSPVDDNATQQATRK